MFEFKPIAAIRAVGSDHVDYRIVSRSSRILGLSSSIFNESALLAGFKERLIQKDPCTECHAYRKVQ